MVGFAYFFFAMPMGLSSAGTSKLTGTDLSDVGRLIALSMHSFTHLFYGRDLSTGITRQTKCTYRLHVASISSSSSSIVVVVMYMHPLPMVTDIGGVFLHSKALCMDLYF
jgi:hypothetical protein